ncbi:MAG: hypothetical protein CM1200mP28_08230 [Deltaproteobacteria bacterium]|nr:MAG: hypothetical protein CM1200mP28_08230 [Deltaproteobacteria bacterium]
MLNRYGCGRKICKFWRNEPGKKGGIELGSNGLIKTNANFQTAQPNIYAVGDVVGFPGLASNPDDTGSHCRAACFWST